MRFLNIIKVALRALRRSALRSVLTALGIIIGIAAVIAVVSIGNGAKSQVEASIASLGQNIINVFPGNFTTGGVRGGWGTASSLTVEDAVAIQREVAGVANLTPEFRDRTQVLANEMYKRAFTNSDTGRGAALAVVLFVSVLPVMYYNIRRMQRER